VINTELADKTGVTLLDLESLAKGLVTEIVAKRLGVPCSDVEDFIRGRGTFRITQRLGLKTISASEELAKTFGKSGAAGIVVGLLLRS